MPHRPGHKKTAEELIAELEAEARGEEPQVQAAVQPTPAFEPDLSTLESRIAAFEGAGREETPFARGVGLRDPGGAALREADRFVLQPLDALAEELFRAGTFQEPAGDPQTFREALDPREIVAAGSESFRERPLLAQLGLSLLDPTVFAARAPGGALRAAPGRIGAAPQSILADRPPTFQPAQPIREAAPQAARESASARTVGPQVFDEPANVQQSRLDAVDAQLAEEARTGVQMSSDEARVFRDRFVAEQGLAPRASVQGGIGEAPQQVGLDIGGTDLRASEANVEELERAAFTEGRAPDPPPVDIPPVGGGAGPPPSGAQPTLGPAEIPPLRGRAEKGRFPHERPDEAALDLHASAITNEERRAGLEVKAGGRELKSLGFGRFIRGQWVPNPEDIPVMDDFFDALHNPSEVASGARRLPAGMDETFQKLRNLTDWEEAARLDFDPEMAQVTDYFFRGWKPPEDAFINQQGTLVRNPSFRLPRRDATYREMRELGFEPLSWNPFEQWRISRMQGVKFRQQTELVDFLKNAGDEFIRPSQGGTPPEGWRTPEIGPAFEGKPHAVIDETTGEQLNLTVGKWITRNDVANMLENAYGKRPNISSLNIGDRTVDPLKIIDWLTFVPKRVKLFGSFFQPIDFLTRAGIGGFEAGFNALRTGHPVESVKHLVGYPGTAVDIIGSFFSPNWREGLAKQLDNTAPIHSSRPNIHIKGISESGLNLNDPSLFNQDPLALDKMVREVVEEGQAAGVIKAVPRAFKELERLMREGLFGGVYPAAIINDIKKNITPQMIRTYPNLTDEQMMRQIAHAANVKFSSLPANQSVVQARWLRQLLTRVMFSLNENEGLLRQATKTLPVGFRLTANPKQIIKSGAGTSKFWTDHWIGAFLFLGAAANTVHFASTGKPLPLDRYRPISGDKWGPLPFGYNTEFASPDIPLTGKGSTQIMLDIVGQMDTALRVLDPVGFFGSRLSVPARAFKNQAEGEDFYGRPIDEAGPGGVFSRTAQLLQDLFSPIGAGQAGTTVIAQEFPETEAFLSPGEEKIGPAGQAVQAAGFNLRAETIDDAVRRQNPGFDQLSDDAQNQLRDQLILDTFGPQTRRDKERFQERIWDLFGQPTDAEREAFNRRLDQEFGTQEPVQPVRAPVPGRRTAEDLISELLGTGTR